MCTCSSSSAALSPPLQGPCRILFCSFLFVAAHSWFEAFERGGKGGKERGSSVHSASHVICRHENDHQSRTETEKPPVIHISSATMPHRSRRQRHSRVIQSIGQPAIVEIGRGCQHTQPRPKRKEKEGNNGDSNSESVHFIAVSFSYLHATLVYYLRLRSTMKLLFVVVCHS
jgi:hypothetical protein